MGMDGPSDAMFTIVPIIVTVGFILRIRIDYLRHRQGYRTMELQQQEAGPVGRRPHRREANERQQG